ncbi:MAG: cation transporter [Clostridia bacterium]|nr:cation transporter [Clostridia bacterium]
MNFLIKLFIKDYKDTNNKDVREKYCVFSGIAGIILNLILFGVKAFSAFAMGSMAVLADAFNNLSDTASSVISVAGAKLSNRRPDKEHPFGHGRIEYLSSLLVSFLIILVGFELLKSSAGKILNPSPVSTPLPILIVLIITIFVKLWMFLYNRKFGKQISSQLLLATAQDSINDSIATTVTVLSACLAPYTRIPLDGIMGVLVSLFIMYGGYSLAKDTADILLGKPADAKTKKELSKILFSKPEIIGIHDLIVHDYGPGRVMASVHAEVSDTGDIVAIHEAIDYLEVLALKEMNIQLVIHMDPINTNCETTNSLKIFINEFLDTKEEKFSIHDLRITDGKENINVIFDLVVPADFTDKKRKEIVAEITEKIENLNNKFSVVINIDDEY